MGVGGRLEGPKLMPYTEYSKAKNFKRSFINARLCRFKKVIDIFALHLARNYREYNDITISKCEGWWHFGTFRKCYVMTGVLLNALFKE